MPHKLPSHTSRTSKSMQLTDKTKYISRCACWIQCKERETPPAINMDLICLAFLIEKYTRTQGNIYGLKTRDDD